MLMVAEREEDGVFEPTQIEIDSTKPNLTGYLTGVLINLHTVLAIIRISGAMPVRKILVCLANSRKVDGHCVAGKEYFGGGRFGGWVRPISTCVSHSLSAKDRSYAGWREPGLLDLIEMCLEGHVPREHQTENFVIDASCQWKRVGRLSWSGLEAAVDKFPGYLWIDGASSRNGRNDQIPSARRSECRNSLLLLEPEEFSICVREEGEFGTHRIRAEFACGGVCYVLSVTDTIIEKQFKNKPVGKYPLSKARICVSVGAPFPRPTDPCYKFVAGVILP
jgi:hypothetical protein